MLKYSVLKSIHCMSFVLRLTNERTQELWNACLIL